MYYLFGDIVFPLPHHHHIPSLPPKEKTHLGENTKVNVTCNPHKSSPLDSLSPFPICLGLLLTYYKLLL